MSKHHITLVPLSVIFILLLSSVYAAEWKVRDTPGKEIPCIDGNCTLILDEVQKFAKYGVYHTFEISGNLIHDTIRIDYYNMPQFNFCTVMFSTNKENPRIFDVRIFKNGKQIAFTPYVNFHGDGKKVAEFPCYLAQSNDTIVIDYYTGGKINPVTDTYRFFNLTRSEVLYPFDKYALTSWSSLSEVYHNRVDKLILPNSLVLVEDESDYSCPAAIKYGMGTKQLNKTTNESIINPLLTLYLYGNWRGFEGGGKGDFVTEDGKRVIIWPTLSSGPIDNLKSINPWVYNFSIDDWDNIYDRRTGCYLTAKFERTEVIKYFFYVASFLIIISSIYFFWYYIETGEVSNKTRVYKAVSTAFLIWSFQEGLSSLTPIVRPTTVTLFDMTLFIPVVFVILYYRKMIFYKPLRAVLSLLTKIRSKVSELSIIALTKVRHSVVKP